MCVVLPAPSPPSKVMKTPQDPCIAVMAKRTPCPSLARCERAVAHRLRHAIGDAIVEGIGHDELLAELLVGDEARKASAAASFMASVMRSARAASAL